MAFFHYPSMLPVIKPCSPHRFAHPATVIEAHDLVKQICGHNNISLVDLGASQVLLTSGVDPAGNKRAPAAMPEAPAVHNQPQVYVWDASQHSTAFISAERASSIDNPPLTILTVCVSLERWLQGYSTGIERVDPVGENSLLTDHRLWPDQAWEGDLGWSVRHGLSEGYELILDARHDKHPLGRLALIKAKVLTPRSRIHEEVELLFAFLREVSEQAASSNRSPADVVRNRLPVPRFVAA